MIVVVFRFQEVEGLALSPGEEAPSWLVRFFFLLRMSAAKRSRSLFQSEESFEVQK